MSLIFSGKSLNECLENASKELSTAKEKVEYKVIKEKHSFISRKVEIEVTGIKLDSSDSNKLPEHEESLNAQKANGSDLIGARVENGKIIVVEASEEENLEPIRIKPCKGIKLFINSELCDENTSYNVTPYDEIEYKSEKTEAVKNAIVTISKDKMEGYICIQYAPEYIYKLEDKHPHRHLALKAEKSEGNYPTKYTVSEIKEILRQNKIVEGVIYKDLIEACVQGANENVLIAKGIQAIDDIPSEVKILFELGEKKIVDENSKGNIDYKNIYSFSNIEEGQVLAEIIPGEIGKDGKDICGEVIKKKSIKNKPVKIGDGCKLEGNKIIATRTGRPSLKNEMLSVNNIYEIQDVDMKSGNVYFVGDVHITGNVKEGMKVRSGNSLLIEKNVDVSTITAGGEIKIKGSVIRSTILTGQVDMEKKMYLEKLNEYKDNIIELTSAVDKLNESSNNSRKISELVKILIENRYKDIPKLSLGIITHNICERDEKNELIDFIRSKMMGLNLSKINSLSDLENLKELIENEIDFIGDNMIIPADIYIGYCQDSLIKSTGSIIITNKGEYVSNLTALKDITFLREDSVVRGGTISARGNIKVGTVGSPAGVATKLEVSQNGIITANIAYNNTIFCFGNKCKSLDTSGKNVKAYMNEDGEIVIDKFAL